MRLKLHWQILIALGLAVAVGLSAGALLPTAAAGGLVAACQFVGTLFLNALKMLIVPLVLSSIITGMVGVGRSGALGRLGGKTLLFYVCTSLLAILVGLFLVNLIAPGLDGDGQPVRERLGLGADVSEIATQVGGRGAGDGLHQANGLNPAQGHPAESM